MYTVYLYCPGKPDKDKDKKKATARKSTTPHQSSNNNNTAGGPSSLNTGQVWEAPWMKMKKGQQPDKKPSMSSSQPGNIE